MPKEISLDENEILAFELIAEKEARLRAEIQAREAEIKAAKIQLQLLVLSAHQLFTLEFRKKHNIEDDPAKYFYSSKERALIKKDELV